MSKEKKCYYHPETTTRISCCECDKPLCTKCIIPTPIGYKCPDCLKEEQKEETETQNSTWFHTIFQSALAGILLGFLWNFIKPYGMFLNWGCAYLIGFAISKSITKYEGFQDKKRFKTAVIVISILSMVYNPISVGLAATELGLFSTIIAFTIYSLSNIINIIALVIGVWAAIRHLKF